MYRGTTQTHTISTEIELGNAVVIYVTYQQNGKTVLEKTIDDIRITEDGIEVSLTQEETLLFDSKRRALVQIRARFGTGQAVASNVMNVDVKKILKEGVI